MPSHHRHENGEVYFITFTCYDWLPLVQEAEAYESFYNFFQYLKKLNVSLLGYVIMPNHFHAIVYIPAKCSKTLNQIIANGKRFLAYDIVKRLKLLGKNSLLEKLEHGVSEKEKGKGKIHQVFQLSFDAKECISEKEILLKLDYIHHNPVAGKWALSEDAIAYPYSSAAFYALNMDNEFVTHFMNIK